MFSDLPELVFHILQSFLSSNEFRNIFNCSKYDETMMQLKKKLCVFHLNEYYSLLYLSVDGKLKGKIMPLIEDPRKQLGINCEELSHEIAEAHEEKKPSPLLTKYAFKLSELNDLNYLKLDSDSPWKEVKKISNLSLFSSIQNMHLTEFNIVKLEGLVSIRELTINDFRKLSNISSLSNCLHLTKVRFFGCEKLVDINAVAHVPDIEISNCPITDQGIAHLGQFLKRLKLCNYSKITSVDHLLSLEILSLRNCRRITSINGLMNLKYLKLYSCSDFQFYSNLISLKSIKAIGCDILQYDHTESLSLKKFMVKIEPKLPIKQLLNLLVMKQSWKSIEILQLHFYSSIHLTTINILAEIPSLRKLYLHNVIDKSFDIHLFQQLIWLSIREMKFFHGIMKPMPNLRTLICPFKPLDGLFSSKKENRQINLEIELKKTLELDDIPFFQYYLGNVSRLRIVSPLSITKTFIKKQQESMIHHTPTINNLVRREMTLELKCSWNDLSKHLFDISIFSPYLQVLILHKFSYNFVSLYEFAMGGIGRIPILAITRARDLNTLYPADILPTHQHLYLEDCFNLTYLGSPSSLQLVSIVSIRNCRSIKDVRGLHGCQKIRIHQEEKLLKGRIEVKGLEEIVDRLENFMPLKEIQEVGEEFDLEYSGRSVDFHYPVPPYY